MHMLAMLAMTKTGVIIIVVTLIIVYRMERK